MIFHKKYKYLFLIIISLGIFGCQNLNVKETNEINNDDKSDVLNIQTSIYPLQFFTEQIGGEFVSVQSIYPPGANDHTFEPTSKNIIEIAEADLFFYNGLELEGFITKAKNSLKKEKVVFIPITENALQSKLGVDYLSTLEEIASGHDDDNLEDHADADHTHEVDPHVWLDPIFATAMAEEIKNILSEKLPEQATIFENNFAHIKLQLEDIHNQLMEISETAVRKQFLITHASFGYWEHRYSIEQIPIKDIYSEGEVSPKKLTELINLVNKHNINHILVEQNESTVYADTLKGETAVTSLPIHNLSVLTTEDISNDDDFFSIMKKNINTLAKALS